MIFLADNSNRTTKLAAGDAREVRAATLRRVPSAGLSVEGILGVFQEMSGITAVAWCSVTTTGPAVLADLARRLGVPALAMDWQSAPLDFSAYPEPETIGPDRLANAVAAAALFPGKPVIAIDAGTAITFNAVEPGDPLPRFLGGAIAPGAGAFTGWLAGNTARLPEIVMPSSDVPGIGSSTVAAMQAAARHGLAGMLREILRAQRLALPGAVGVVTGTDAVLVAGLLGENVIHAPLLTLDGLRRCAIAAGW